MFDHVPYPVFKLHRAVPISLQPDVDYNEMGSQHEDLVGHVPHEASAFAGNSGFAIRIYNSTTSIS